MTLSHPTPLALARMSLALCILVPSAALADPPQVVSATAEQVGGTWRIAVTLAHPDTGWDHYADGWEVLDAAGNRLGHRVLTHPHVSEQPFTRSLSGIDIPEGIQTVFIRPHCNVDGPAAETLAIDLR